MWGKGQPRTDTQELGWAASSSQEAKPLGGRLAGSEDQQGPRHKARLSAARASTRCTRHWPAFRHLWLPDERGSPAEWTGKQPSPTLAAPIHRQDPHRSTPHHPARELRELTCARAKDIPCLPTPPPPATPAPGQERAWVSLMLPACLPPPLSAGIKVKATSTPHPHSTLIHLEINLNSRKGKK